jgi:proteasome accessory factor C
MSENAALRALRLLDLVPFIVRNPGISIKELAVRFEVSRDELIKDLNLLFMCGLPGYTPLELIDLSFEDGTVAVRDPQNLVAPRNFNESEALALRIALAALEEQTPKNHPSYSIIQSLRRKITAAFTSEIPDGAIDVVADKEEIVINTIKQALEKEADLELEYMNAARDTRSLRRVSPMSLSISGTRTLLNSYCHTAKGERSFNVKAIYNVRLIEREKQDDDYLNNTKNTTEVLVDISSTESKFYKEHQEAFLPTGKSSAQNRYFIHVYQPEWIIRSTISEPNSVFLVKPEGFRKAIVERCGTALEQYAVIG